MLAAYGILKREFWVALALGIARLGAPDGDWRLAMGPESGKTGPKTEPGTGPATLGPRPVAAGGADATAPTAGDGGQQGERAGAAWKTALLLGGSVLLGAAAMALWNRRTLAKLQEQARQSK